MRVLVCGASGFIGAAVCTGLAQAGHSVLRGVRVRSGEADVAMDFARDDAVDAWLPRLKDVDAVINAVGTLSSGHLRRIQALTPMALFAACERAGVQRVIQISALGAAADAPSEFLRTKSEADRALAASAGEWMILRPSLVAGRDGESSRWFRVLASLPVVPLPGGGGQTVQPVALGDVVQAVLHSLACAPARRTVDLVGADVLTLRRMLEAYRTRMRAGPARWLPVPIMLMRAVLPLARPLRLPLASADTLRMLEASAPVSAQAMTRLLGRAPRPFDAEFAGVPAQALRSEAVTAWAAPLLRLALALVWLVTAWVSLFVFPVWDSLRMLARVGVPGWSAPLLLVGAAGMDALLGVLTLLRPSRALWWVQLALIVFYSAVIAWRLPEMWAHPFGPLLKNVPIAAILIVLLGLETDRRRR